MPLLDVFWGKVLDNIADTEHVVAVEAAWQNSEATNISQLAIKTAMWVEYAFSLGNYAPFVWQIFPFMGIAYLTDLSVTHKKYQELLRNSFIQSLVINYIPRRYEELKKFSPCWAQLIAYGESSDKGFFQRGFWGWYLVFNTVVEHLFEHLQRYVLQSDNSVVQFRGERARREKELLLKYLKPDCRLSLNEAFNNLFAHLDELWGIYNGEGGSSVV